MDFIESCRRFIAIDSSPSQGDWAIAHFAAELCRARGLQVEALEESTVDQKQMNLIAKPLSATADQDLLLQTHLDTPDPGPFGLWEKNDHNPFDAHIIDQKIYGLGAADVKLDFLCKLEAICSFPTDTKWKRNPVLVGTYGEESGMAGALKLIRKNKIKAKWAFVGEPSGLQLITAGKGIATVEIRVPFSVEERNYRAKHNLQESSSTQSRIFSGRAAHSSTPQLGESAIKKMFQFLAQLPEDITIMDIGGGVNFNAVPARAFLEIEPVSNYAHPMAKKLNNVYKAVCSFEEEFLQYTDERFIPAHPTLNIGVIKNFEDHVYLSGSCRITPAVGNEVYEAWIDRFTEACRSVGGELRITDYKRPFLTETDSEFALGSMEVLKKLRVASSFMTQPSTNEASLFSRIGVECLCFGPGQREGNIHTPQEHVSIDDLYAAIEFYSKAIARFCL